MEPDLAGNAMQIPGQFLWQEFREGLLTWELTPALSARSFANDWQDDFPEEHRAWNLKHAAGREMSNYGAQSGPLPQQSDFLYRYLQTVLVP